MRSQVQSVERRTPATPLSEDVLELLRKQIMGGTFGQGFGPLQREAGTAIRQFVEGREITPERLQGIAQPIVDISRRETERSAADLREGFGAQGTRFGTTAALGEGRLRADAQQNLDQTISQLFEQIRQFETGQLLQGIGTMQGMGMQNIAPFFDLAQLGILAPDTVVRPSLFSEILGPLSGAAAGTGSALMGLGPQGAGLIGG